MLSLLIAKALAFEGVIKLNVDARMAGRSFMHSHISIPAAPGQFTVVYPKWIPGEHSPTGPINDVVGLHFHAGGKEIPWQRDDVEMFAFHLNVPEGVHEVVADFDLAFKGNTIGSPNFCRIKWNRLVLYPQGVTSDSVQVKPSLTLPNGWHCATALKREPSRDGHVLFDPVTLTRLVDSPALIGRYTKHIQVGDQEAIELFGDSQKPLEAKPESVAKFKNLISEAQALFGAHHYDSYRFLLTLSGHGGDDGLEHHETSEDGTAEDSLSDELDGRYLGYLLSHEYTHSWNGKYRRPADLATANFQDPMHGDLLWVYEGMTEFIGTTLNPRSGLWSQENYRDALAEIAAVMEYTQGRSWRPLVDTARSVQLLFGGGPAWSSARRSADYYYEMVLVWLEADVKITQLTGGKKSLDDFCKLFHGGTSTGPHLTTYTFDDVVSGLNAIAPYDWAGFLHERVYSVQPHSPIKGITESGWKLIYSDKPNDTAKQYEGNKGASFLFSIGMSTDEDGSIRDVLPGSASAKASLSPAMKLISVDGYKYTADRLKEAIASGKINLLVDTGDEGYHAITVKYSQGLRYPHLERDSTKPDLLTPIASPHAK